jgi:hypothetical protein
VAQRFTAAIQSSECGASAAEGTPSLGNIHCLAGQGARLHNCCIFKHLGCAIQVRDFASPFLNLALFPHFDPQGNSNRICFPLNISKRIIRIRRFIPL